MPETSSAIQNTSMEERLIFIVGAPRSGSTLLERMLEAHSQIHGGPEPHLLTPLAHLGYWANAERGPYDIEGASEALHAFVASLPQGEADYYQACRAYCDRLYGQYMAESGKRYCLDKTPAYALVLPFIAQVYPRARFLVLTRHPIAIFSSYANSFFNGDYEAAWRYNPILERYIPAMADFLRGHSPPLCHLRYEELVREPIAAMRRVCVYFGLPFEPGMVTYGKARRAAHAKKGLGDPINVDRHVRPMAASVDKWAAELFAEPHKRRFIEPVVDALPEKDLEVLGYPKGTLFRPLEQYGLTDSTPPEPPKQPRVSRYRLQRWAITRFRSSARGNPLTRGVLRMLRRVCIAALEGR